MAKVVKFGNVTIGEGHKPPVIAEAGINHNGDFDKAKALVVEAAECGAEIIKFQAHLAEHEMLRGGFTAEYVGEPLFDLIDRCSLKKEEFIELQKLANDHDIQFLATPFSREAADMLEELNVNAFKIGSGEVTNIPLMKHIARKKKPMLVSTGMTLFDEVAETLEAILPINPNVVLFHCTSTYPTRFEDVRLHAIGQLNKRFGLPVGFSDHSPGVCAAVASVALGAAVIEKHFTLDRSWPGPDQAGSLEPHELRRLVEEVDAVFKSLKGKDEVLEEEVGVQKMARESLVVITSAKAGETLTEKNLWVKRPGTGIPSREYDSYIGKKLKKDMAANTLLAPGDVE